MTIRAAAVLVLLAVQARAADDPVSFRFRREVQTPPRAQEELVRIALDGDVYAETMADLSDLRIVGPGGQPLPFLVQKQAETRPQTVRQTWPARNVKLRPLDDGGLELRFGLSDEPPHPDPQPTGFRLVSPLRNFEQRVRVFGLDATGAEKPLVSDALIFDYSQYMDVSHNEIALPVSSHRRFRVVVDGVTSDQESQLLELTRRLRSGREEERQERTTIQRRPFRIDRIEFSRDETRTSTQGETVLSYPVEKFEVRSDDEHKQTVIEIQSRREPLVAFRLETPTRNFSRSAAVQAPETRGGRTIWRSVATSTISRFQFRDIQKEELRISFSERRHKEFRVVIDNRDNPPLEITGVEAEGHVHQLVMLAAPEAAHRLEYGAEVDRRPDYDTAAIRAALDRGIEPVDAELGPPTAATAAPRRLDLKGLLNNPIAIGGLIVILVVALGWSLYHASRRVEQLPPEEP